MMKEVLLVCLILSVLFWYTSRHVCCSEEGSTASAQLAQDSGPQAKHEENIDSKGADDGSTEIQSSYDVGLRAEQSLQIHTLAEDCTKDEGQEQNVKADEPQPKPEPASLTESMTEAEPASLSESVTEAEPDLDPDTDPDPDPDPDPTASLYEATSSASATTDYISSTPTSEIPPVTQPSPTVTGVNLHAASFLRCM